MADSSSQTTQTPPPGRPPVDELRGALFMLAAACFFAVGFGIVKYLTFHLPEPMIGFLRCVFAALCFIPIGIARPQMFVTHRPLGHLWRSTIGYLSFLTFIYALTLLPLSDAMTLSFTAPLWTVLIGAVFFRERLTWRLGAALGVGFAGVLLIAAPTGQGYALGAAAALTSALMSSLAMAAVKRLTATEPPDRIAFYFMTLGGVVACGFALFDWQWPAPADWLPLAATGLFFFAGQRCLTRAYTYGSVSRVSPLDFARLPLTVLVGFLLFDEVPSLMALGGMVLISLGALDLLLVARRQRATAPPG